MVKRWKAYKRTKNNNVSKQAYDLAEKLANKRILEMRKQNMEIRNHQKLEQA